MTVDSVTTLNSITARDLMSHDVVSIGPESSIAELAGLLEDRGISGVLVRQEDGKPIGVVSVTDISSAEALAGRTPETPASRSAFYAQGWDDEFDDFDLETIRIEDGKETVADLMTPQVVSVPADATVAEIAHTMLYQHIHRVFVHQDEEIVGLISTTDLLGLLAGPSDD